MRLDIDTGNAAFHDQDDRPDPGPELARILRRVADLIESGRTEGKTLDVNGNTVGGWEL